MATGVKYKQTVQKLPMNIEISENINWLHFFF